MSGLHSSTSSPESCPVCKARFRGATVCSRCGADLSKLMLLAAHAHALRHSARQSLRQGDCPAALAFVRTAQQLHATAEGHLLLLVISAIDQEQ